jgi:hypothetical protein
VSPFLRPLNPFATAYTAKRSKPTASEATKPARTISACSDDAHSDNEPNRRKSPLASSQKTPGSPLPGSTDGVKRRSSSAICATSSSISASVTTAARSPAANDSPAA